MTDLPTDVTEEAERLTRLARDAVDEAEAEAYRTERDDMLAEYDYTARIRNDDTGDVLVCHPVDWVDDGVIRPERVDDIDRGVERRLSGPGDPDAWAEIDAENRAVVEAVTDAHGETHGANAELLADFMGNHYAKHISDATPAELAEFRDDYVPRNAWPTEDQQTVLEESIRLAVEEAGGRVPET
ncbi:DUF7108 family protein [Haloarcula brevis]|uniref:DUF7108 family protein n=1 Tax=Haloarcula brevis TaxID=3111453 RepID=UPI00300EF95F